VNAEVAKRFRLLASAVSVLVLLGLVALGWIYGRVRASLPQLDGRARIAGLTASATVARDSLGVPTIIGQNRADVARALGFVHAQDRFFQMDVWRRAAAGELAEVFGKKTLAHDTAMRRHGFRAIAQRAVAQLPPDQRAVLEAYTDGVNAGLAALREKPFEYLIVHDTPQPWKPEDTMLVGEAMTVDLQDDSGHYDQTLMSVRDHFGREGLDFFAPLLSPADAALDGTSAQPAPIPGPKVIDLRAKTSAVATGISPAFAIAGHSPGLAKPQFTELFPFGPRDPELTPGSNAFALAGAHTADGSALLASDIHLNLAVPNTWYRASLEFPGHKITGVTLPGTPLVIAGSNGHVAWSFTNAYADTGDLVSVELNPVAPTLYRAPGHEELLRIDERKETIKVKDSKPVVETYNWTIWGPVVGKDGDGRPLVYDWVAHDPAAINLALLAMEDVTDVKTAVARAHDVGLPAQNILIVDSTGDIAWTIAGRLPQRFGYDGRLPVSFQFGDRGWKGLLPGDQVPVISTTPIDAATLPANDGRLWSGNQRMVGGEALAKIGDGGYARPARAAQIRDDIHTLEHATPRDLLRVQLDDHALFLTPWHQLLLDTLTSKTIAEKKIRGDLRGFAEKWEGSASVNAVSYPIVRMFRLAVYARVFDPIFHACLEDNPNMQWATLHLEDAVWKILHEKPAHLLDPQYASWDALLVAAVDDTILELDRQAIRLPHATWGVHNTAQIRHPFSYSLPAWFGAKLDMPADQLPGDVDMPRVQTPTHGASERFVVSPGHEAEGIFHMPCGQSGHPLSPYYRAGHEAWVRGDPTPFLPGKTDHTLTLTP
jgi:penicillin G amidase